MERARGEGEFRYGELDAARACLCAILSCADEHREWGGDKTTPAGIINSSLHISVAYSRLTVANIRCYAFFVGSKGII